MGLVSKKLGSDILEESVDNFILIYKMVLEGDINIKQSGREHISVTSQQMSDPFSKLLTLGGVIIPLYFFT